MTDVLFVTGVLALAGVGLFVVIRATIAHFDKKASEAKPECRHEWEPWSEPKEVDVKSKDYGFYQSGVTEKEYKGKFQERVCSKCNVYDRRWA